MHEYLFICSIQYNPLIDYEQCMSNDFSLFLSGSGTAQDTRQGQGTSSRETPPAGRGRSMSLKEKEYFSVD